MVGRLADGQTSLRRPRLRQEIKVSLDHLHCPRFLVTLVDRSQRLTMRSRRAEERPNGERGYYSNRWPALAVVDLRLRTALQFVSFARAPCALASQKAMFMARYRSIAAESSEHASSRCPTLALRVPRPSLQWARSGCIPSSRARAMPSR